MTRVTVLQRPTPAEPKASGPDRRSVDLGAKFRPFARPLAWYAASRLLILVIGAVAFAVRPDYGVKDFFGMWDADWYMNIVRHGYPTSVPDVAGPAARTRLAFFPLYPLLVEAVSWALPVSDLAAGVIVSMLLGAVCVVLLSHLARTLKDEATANRAVALFCFFPGSIVLSVAYSEGLMIALAGACMIALLRRRWVAAGVAAGFATAARPNAIALVAACAWQSAVAIRRRREWRSLAAPLLAPAGLFAFFAFLWVHTGVPDAWFQVERKGWNQRFDFGLHALDVLWDFLRDPLGYPARFVVVCCLIFLIVAVVIQLRGGFPGFVNVYTLVLAAMAAMSTIDIVRLRAILTAFPVFIALGVVTKRPAAFRLLLELLAVATVLELLFPTWGSP